MKLVIENITKSFGEKKVLKGIDFTFEKGKIYGLLGRNGSGKTTLFNCLAGDIKADSGRMKLVEDAERDIKIEDIGYVLSTPVVPDFLTAKEFLKFFLEINKGEATEEKMQQYFSFLKIEKEDQDKVMKDFSHGMKNKMQMLVNIIAEPVVLLLDEPLTSFDVVVADEMKKLLREIKDNHILIFSTHILELATDLCDEIVILNHGKLDLVDHNDLNSVDFKEKIIEMLKDEDHDSNK